MELTKVKSAKGFNYSEAPQLSPDWVALRVGRVTASELKRWLALNKAGDKPLQARKDYERELAFEKQFNVPFSKFVTSAMEQGRMAEAYMREEYQSIVGDVVTSCGAFYNDRFVASPDGFVGDDGLVEFKWLYDTSFSDVLINGVPKEYELQVQGQLLASGRKWCDFVAGNGNTGRFKVIRVYPDKEVHKAILDSLPALDDVQAQIETDGLFTFSHTYNNSNTTPESVGW